MSLVGGFFRFFWWFLVELIHRCANAIAHDRFGSVAGALDERLCIGSLGLPRSLRAPSSRLGGHFPQRAGQERLLLRFFRALPMPMRIRRKSLSPSCSTMERKPLWPP